MTSASELFCNRRWRPRRGTAPEVSLEPPAPPPGEYLDLDLRGPGRRRRGRCCGRIRRKERGEACCLLRPSYAGRQTPPESGAGSSSRVGFPLCRVKRWRCAANDQLPDIVVQARERLLQRLQGISLGDHRQTSSISGGSQGLEGGNGNTLEGPHHGELFASAIPSVGTDERVQNSSTTMKKPQGLSWEAFCSLQLEVFQEHGQQDEETVGSSAAAAAECSICLEQFHEGDELIRLICRHRFHPACLEPWLRSCGDCPYCRARL